MEHKQQAGLPSRRTDHDHRGSGRRWVGALYVLIIAVVLLSGCAPGTQPSVRSAAQQNKAKLDAELRKAQTTSGIPKSVLHPIETQESALAASVTNGSDKNGQAAAKGYAILYDQVVALERMTPDQAKAKASSDLQTLTQALKAVQDQGFTEAATFQPRVQRAQQQIATATTTNAYFTADAYILDQSAAVTQILPVYQQMQALEALVKSRAAAFGSSVQPLQCAVGDDTSFWRSAADINPSSYVSIGGAQKYVFQSWPQQNLAAFRAAQDAAAFSALASMLQAQTLQLTADAAALLPQQTFAAVQQFEADVSTYQSNGGTDGSYAQRAAQDAQWLTSVSTYSDYSKLLNTVQAHDQALQLPLVKVQANHDMQTLTNLVLQANAKTTLNPADGIKYPDAYEYIGIHYSNGHNWAGDPIDRYDTEHYLGGTGIGDARARLANAQTPDDYQAVDQELQMFITNIQAMLTNLAQMPTGDQARKAWSMQVHQTDLDLMNYYGVGQTKVVVVSLREQKARLYSNGKLVVGSDGLPYAFDVTTGNPDLPSVPGAHCVTTKMENYNDISPFPKGSPYYYNPTHINFGMVYSDYGFIIHDAWWRDDTSMGYLTNLPHYDPLAFNSGSHGCINFHLLDHATGRHDMEMVYTFAGYGTPVIVY